MSREFVNREKECADLSSRLNFDTKPRIIFVTGISGIGKSAFTKKVLEEREYIRLEINDLIESNVDQGAYIQELAKAINNYCLTSKKEELSFRYYFNNSLTPHLRKRNLSIIGGAATNIAPYRVGKLLSTATKMIFKLGEYNYNAFFNSGNNDILQTLRDYIEYVIRKNSLIIVIENYQKIDRSSHDILKNIITQSFHTNFIFEFTVDNSFSKSKFEEVHVKDFPNVDLYLINLVRMNLSEYLKMYPDSEITEKLRDSFLEFDGNIRKLEDGNLFFNMRGKDIVPFNSSVNEFNYTKTHIDSLENHLKLVLSAIIAHRLPVTTESLKFFLESELFKDLWIDLEPSLKKLTKHELIKIDKEYISVKHDFISKEILSNNSFDRFVLPSYRIWIEYYRKKLEQEDFSCYSKNKIYHLLFTFYSAGNDSNNLFKLLPEIKRVALESTYPDSAVEYLELLRNNEHHFASIEIQDSINFALIDIYYTLGIFDKAWDILAEIKGKSNRYIAYKAALLDRLDKHQEAISYIQNTLISDIDDRLILILKLILMISYRSSNNNTECKKVYLDMMGKAEYAKYDEYGFLLRNSEIVLPLSKSIKELKKSILFFKQRNLLVEMGQSYLTLSLLNTWSKDYRVALSNLDIAEELLYNETFERHIFFNDRAVIHMYQNNFSEEVGNLLREARKTVMCSFDKLTIHINHLIYYTILNKRNGIFKAYEDIVNSTLNLIEEQPDKVMHRLVYYTIAQYYKNHSIDLFHFYMRKSHETHLLLSFRINNYWDERFSYYESTQTTKDDIETFDLGLISYWHFRIPEDI
ncbi:MAG: ATP-binding protein [Firmicutes bacterium]|nr:ATP-binding protein [Bacillota bacterium]MCL2312322.1 ATP-binding protein [Bacillota bacterium]